MTSHAAIGIDDDLTACEARIALRTADDETASRIDEEFRLVVEQAFRQFRFDVIRGGRFRSVRGRLRGCAVPK